MDCELDEQPHTDGKTVETFLATAKQYFLTQTSFSDTSFDDVEDSFQYQCALQAKCDALVTINLRDYRNADTSNIEILSPTEFVEKYL